MKIRSFKHKTGKYIADCKEIDSYDYTNGYFSFGLARGMPHGDNFYFAICKGKNNEIHFIKQDEVMAMVSGLSRCLWLDYGIKNKRKWNKGA